LFPVPDKTIKPKEQNANNLLGGGGRDTEIDEKEVAD
jgi:hypothetical protein